MMAALAGVLVTAAVGLVGAVITLIAQRHEERARIEEQRRLRLDAAMRAGELLASKDGAPPDPAAVASGLLALTDLGQAALAVALLVDLWSPERDGDVSTETAILVINEALCSDDTGAQLVAAELLCRRSESLDPCQSLHWPSAIDGQWLPQLGNRSKLLLVDGLVRMTLTSDPSENALRSIAVRLYGIASGDPDPRVKRCVGRLIKALVPALQALGYSDFMQGSRVVTLDELKEATRFVMDNPDGMLERIVTERTEALATWAPRCDNTITEPGCLAHVAS
jgi:hypothetical protein